MSWDASDEDTWDRWTTQADARRATCAIRGCGVVADSGGTHCRTHQAALDAMANRAED